jgi:hypothetical protein
MAMGVRLSHGRERDQAGSREKDGGGVEAS